MRWLWALLDLPAHIHAIMQLRGRWGFTQSFVIFLAAMLLSFPVGWGYWVGDQVATWNWLQPLRTFLVAPVEGAAIDEQGNITTDGRSVVGPDTNNDGTPDQVQVAGRVLSLGMLLAIAIWCVNFSPTLIQIAFPPIVRTLPAQFIGSLVIFLKAAMLFDYVTDWPDMWKLITAFNWPDWWVFTTALQFIACVFGTLIVSMVLQTVLGSLIALMVVSVMNMAGARANVARAQVIDH
jgi:hypothetical protein